MNDLTVKSRQIDSTSNVKSIGTINSPENKVDSTNIQTEEKINTQDQNKVKNLKKGSSAESIDLVGENKHGNSVNPLAAILAIFMLIGGAGAGAAYNPELCDLLQAQLAKASSIIQNDGMSTDMNIFGNIREKEKQQELQQKKETLDKKE